MKIGQNKVVEFVYELEVDGQVVDKTVVERPLDYIHGTGSLLPKLEEHIEGMQAGDKFDVTLSPADGYGPHRNWSLRTPEHTTGEHSPLLHRAETHPGLFLCNARHKDSASSRRRRYDPRGNGCKKRL